MAETGLNQGVLTTSPHIVKIRQLPITLHRHRVLIFSVSCTVISFASLLALITKPTYESSMQMLITSNLYEGMRSTNSSAKKDKEFTEGDFAVDYTTQLKIMLSSRLIEKAVDLLRPEYPHIKIEDIKGESGNTSLVVNEVNQTGANKSPSQIVEVSYQNKNPVKAQKVLQALQKVYQEYNTEQQKQRLSQGLAYLSDRLPRIQQEVARTEKKLEEFRKKNNLLDPEVQGKMLLESLAQVKRQLETTRTQLRDIKARYNDLQKLTFTTESASLFTRLSHPRYQNLLKEIQKTESALSEERQRYTEDAPSVKSLVQQRQNQLTLLQAEIGQTLQPNQSFILPGQLTEVDLRLMQELVELQSTAKNLTDNEKSLVASESQISKELARYPSLIAEYNQLRPKLESDRKKLEQLQQMQQSLGMRITQEGYNWQVLEEPHQGTLKSGDRLLTLLGGLLLAPILGVAAAITKEMFNDAVDSPQELEKLTQLPLLGSVPTLTRRDSNRRISLPFTQKKSSIVCMTSEQVLPHQDTLDMVYQNIQILKHPLHFKSLMLTSAVESEGKSTLALGLAVSAARMHRRVLLIDGNLRHPSLHKTLELSDEWGLSSLLIDETNTSFKNYIQPIHPAIDVLTAGSTLEDTVKLLSSRRMKELLEQFEQNYDLVLVDASGILGMVDGRILASLCNAIALVARIGKVTRGELIQARDILSKLNLIGAIANDV